MRKFLVAGLACALPLVAAVAGSARADTGTAVPQLANFHQMVADGKPGYLFLSGNGEIVVTTLAGTYVTTLDSGDGVQGLALSADGNTLYAALTQGAHADSVAKIDVSSIGGGTLAQTYDALAAGDAPYSLAVQSGKLWVSYTDSAATSNPGTIGDIDLSTDTFEPASAAGTWSASPDLAADPGNGGTLVAVLSNAVPAVAATYTTTSGAPVTLAAQASLGAGATQCQYEHQIAVAPGGGTFIAACGTPQSAAYAYKTADLTAAAPDHYPTAAAFPGGAAVDADGSVAVGTYGSPSAIDVYKADGTLLNIFNLGSASLVYLNALAWADTGSGPVLAALVQPSGTATYTVDLFTAPEETNAILKLSTPAKAALGRPVTIAGTLALSTGAALPAGQTVTVTRIPAGTSTPMTVAVGTDGAFTATDTPAATGSYTYTVSYSGIASTVTATSAQVTVAVALNTAKISLSGPATNAVGKSLTIKGVLAFGVGGVPAGTTLTVTRTAAGVTKKVFTVRTGTSGAFQLTDTPTVAGKYTYAAAYAGNATTVNAAASHVVSEVKTMPSLSLVTGATTVNYQSTVHVTAILGKTYSNRTVAIYAHVAGTAGKKLIKSGRVNSGGQLTVSYAAQRNTTFSVVFAGDARYSARTVTRAVGVRAKVTLALSGYYGTKTSSGVTYKLYHKSGHVNIAVTVTPNKHGECVQIEIQEYYQGTWYSQNTGCAALGSTSKISGYLTVSQADLGYPYRIRADYVASSSTNKSNDSTWQYLMVEP